MSKCNLSIYSILALLVMALPIKVMAGGGAATGGATEWTQMANNFELVKVGMDGAQTAATTVEKYLLQLKQYQNELNNLAKFADLPENIQHGLKSYDDLVAYKSRMEQLHGSLSQQKDIFERRFAESRLNGGTWKDYVDSVRQDASDKNQRAINRLQYESSVLDQVGQDYAAARALEPKIRDSIGAQQSMQLMNTQMNRLVIQNAKMTEVMVTAMQEQTRQQHEDAKRRDEDAVTRDQMHKQQTVIRDRQRAAANALRVN